MMRRGFKSHKKLGLISIAIIMIAVICASTLFNGTNVTSLSETKELKASNTESTLSTASLIGEALNLASQRAYGYNCNGLVESAIHKATGNTGNAPVGGTTTWYNGGYTFAYEGTTYTVDTPIFTGTKPGGTSWFDAYNSSNETMRSYIDSGRILPGDIVVGYLNSTEGHMFMYLGKANSYEELIQNLNNSGVTIPENVYSIARTSLQAGANYWYIEGNVNAVDSGVSRKKGTSGNYIGNGNNYNIPCVTNYDWKEQIGQSGNMYNIKVYRVSGKKTGKYNISIGKKDSNTNAYVAGATLSTRFNNDNTGRGEENGKRLTVTTAAQKLYLSADSNWNNNENNYMDIKTEVADVYAVSELNAPEGYKPNVYNDYICIEVLKNQNLSQANIKGINLFRGMSRSGERLNQSMLEISDSEQTWYIKYNNDTLSLEETKPSKSTLVGEITLGENGCGLDFNFYNEKMDGNFDINLVKYLKGTTQKLNGAVFTIKVEKYENGRVVGDPIKVETKTTTGEGSEKGRINIGEIPITNEGETYKVTLTEDSAPSGYIGLEGPIEFFVETELKNGEYVLQSKPADTTITNAKKVEVKENEILVEAENRITKIDINKGIKSVENQSSGYYEVPETTYTDDRGDTYTEIGLEKVVHSWVIETTIPEDVSKYAKYVVTDPIDISKLSYVGINKVELVKENNQVIALTENTDYQANYETSSGILTVTYINKKAGNNFIGNFLKEEGLENCKIRVVFNTRFKKVNGKLAVLDGVVTNAENRAKITYDTGNGVESWDYSENPEVHTGAVSVFKFEDKNGNKKHDEDEEALVGAVFKIAETEEKARNNEFLKIDGKEVTATSNEHGIATFTGLEFGDDAIKDITTITTDRTTGARVYKYDWSKVKKDYYIVETEAPDGYELLDEVIKVTISKNSTQMIDLTSKIDEMEPVGNKQLEFDLALRKSIYSVEKPDGTIVYPDPNRLPELNALSYSKLMGESLNGSEEPARTAGYFHTKQAVNVETGDIVRYRIYVYNEADTKGYATKIADYLPEGLEFKEGSAVNSEYGWSVVGTQNGITTVETTKLATRLLNECKLKDFLLGNNDTSWYSYVDIECRVTKQPTEKIEYLTNRAEITEDKAVIIDSNGEEKEVDIEDRDSQPANAKKLHERDMLNYDDTIEYSPNVHYEGYQDDDDKETVTISKTKHYNFILNKVDEKGQPLHGAVFTIKKEVNGTFVDEFYGVVNGTKTVAEPALSSEHDVKINQTYTYKIAENGAKAGYENLLQGKYVIVKTYMNENKQMVRGEYGDNDANSYFNKYGFEIHNYEDDSKILDTETDLYEKITFSPETTTTLGVYPPSVTLTIPNEKIIEGKYKLVLRKIDDQDATVGGISFVVGSETKVTPAVGGIVLTDETVNNGYVKINKNNVSVMNSYMFRELQNTASEGYVTIKDQIVLDVTKALDESRDEYYVSNIKVTYTNIDGETSKNLVIDNVTRTGYLDIDDVLTVGNGKTNVFLRANNNGEITIFAQNYKKTGDYNIQILKVDKSTNPISGIKFKVGDTTVETGSNGYTRKINKVITKDNVNSEDKYEIKELKDSQGRCVELKNPIELKVTKKQTPNRYIVDTIQLSEKNTSNVSAVSNEASTITLSNVQINDETGRTVTVRAYVNAYKNIMVTVENETPTGKFNLKVKKTNTSTGYAVNGITFQAKDEDSIIHTSVTDSVSNGGSTENGVAYLLENDKVITESKSYIYLIEETGTTVSMPELMLIRDYGLEVRFNTTYSTAKNSYVIDKNSVTARVVALRNDATAEQNARQRELMQEAADSITVDETEQLIVIPVKNENLATYEMKINKININNINIIPDAKFTIYENGEIIKYNDYLGASETDIGGYSILKENVLPNTTHEFDIYEEEPASGYRNIFENTYIHLTVTVDEDGVATPSYEIRARAGSGTAEVNAAKAYVEQYKTNSGTDLIVTNGNNRYNLYIPNPQGEDEPKNPKFYVSLHKAAGKQTSEPLSGATLTLTTSDLGFKIINGGSSETEPIAVEIANGEVKTFEIREQATVKGFKNILKDKKLIYNIKNTDGRIYILSTELRDLDDNPIVGEDKINVMKYVTVSNYTTVAGDGIDANCQGFKVYIGNPNEFNFTLKKEDIGGNLLSGATVKVVSSHSGVHYLSSGSSISFVEKDVKPHEVIEYEIREINTVENSSYVNKFDLPIKIEVYMVNGVPTITSKKHMVELPNGSKPYQDFDTLENFNCYVTPEDVNSLNEGEMQTVVVELENPTQIEVELLKTTAKDVNPIVISNTKFTISSKTNHTGYTDYNGKINFLEGINTPGMYTIRVYEDQVASSNYINILKDRYMKIDINVTESGAVTIIGAPKFYVKDEDEDFSNDVEVGTEEATKLAGYCTATVDATNPINKVKIHVKDPLVFNLVVKKQTTDGTSLNNASFNVTSPKYGTMIVPVTTEGEVVFSQKEIEPGVYECKVSENSTAGAQYDNIFEIYNEETGITEQYEAVIYLKVSETGIVNAVADIAGNEFTDAVVAGQRYYVRKVGGAAASSKAEAIIRSYCSIDIENKANGIDEVVFKVENPVKQKINIIKKQLDEDGNEVDLAGTRFTVIKNDTRALLQNAEVSTAVEIEEHYLKESEDYYDIYEVSTSNNGAYVNILQDKFIRVYTRTSTEGKITIEDDEGNRGVQYGDNHSYYFEIYKIMHMGTAVKLERSENKELYESVYVNVEKDANDVYTLNVKVINPITINVGVMKTQVGNPGMPIDGVAVKVISDISGEHNITSAPYETIFSEGNTKPGTYNFIIKEEDNPNKKYVNILKNRYARANVTISNEGEILVNSISYYADNGDTNYTNDAAITNAQIVNMLDEYIHVTVNSEETINKLCIVIENPISVDMAVNKVDENQNPLAGANFKVTKHLGDNTAVIATVENTTGASGELTFEGSDIMEPGVYRYEITELGTAGNQYVNVLDNFEDGSKYKVVVYVKLNPDGTTEFVGDAAGTALAGNEAYKYFVRKIADNSEASSDVTSYVRKHVSISKTSNDNQKDKINITFENTAQIDIDIIKTTRVDGVVQNLEGTIFSACMDDGKVVFKDVEATVDIEHRLKNVEPGNHIFYITENSGMLNSKFINTLEDRYIKVYVNVASNGTLKIVDNNGNDSEHYFEIYAGKYNSISNSKMLDKTEYADLYSKVNVSAVKQTISANNGIYKLKVEVENPERNYKVTLNKSLFGRDNINIKGAEFFVLKRRLGGEIEGMVQQKTNAEGNLVIEHKQALEGVYEYYITETKSAGSEFVNVLENNYIKVIVKVNQDGTIHIADINGDIVGNENKYYILDEAAEHMVSEEDTVVDEYVNVSATNEGSMPELRINIKNPQYYNFKLVKKDKDTDEAMNNVKFNLRVYHQSEHGPLQEVNLTDAKTLEPLDISELITANVDGVDGVISIPNILINETGTYTFIFHEVSTNGIFDVLYKSPADDIGVEIDISVGDREDDEGQEYIISTPRISTGAKYVDFVETTSTKAQTTSVGATNERIKGTYSLKVLKLDKVTEERLNGAKFNITVKKGNEEYQLYRATDNVESRDVIIPSDYTIENGELIIDNIRIERPETYTIILTETEAPRTAKAPNGYMLLDVPIELQVTTDRDGAYDDEKYVLKEVKLVGGNNHNLVAVSNTEDEINVVAKDEYFDLALRKSITSVSYSDSDDGKITEDKTKNRVPEYAASDALFKNEATTAGYNHVKNHVRAYVGQEVIYTLRVYNEGEIDGYAEEITDHLPEGLEFVNDKFNSDRGWVLDRNDPTLRTVRTKYLSKDNNPNNDRFNSENNLIKAVDNQAGVIDYKEIEIKCKISEGAAASTILTNIAEISMCKANNRTAATVDRDSKTNPGANIPGTSQEMQNYKEDRLTDDRNTYVPGQEDDDDFEKIVVEEFDLALRKYITAINEEELYAVETEEKYTDVEDTEEATSDVDRNNAVIYEREPRVNVSTLKEGSSTTATYKHTKEPIEVSVGDVVTYTLEVFNEGTIDGYATLIKDDIPEGLEFISYNKGDGSINDIYGWKMVDANDEVVTDPQKAKYIVSDYLSKDNEKDGFSNLIKAFNPSTSKSLDSKYVQVQFRVVCKQNYPQIITNYAQIADDSDENGGSVIDRDSTPNKWVEDSEHIDDDQDVEHIRVTYMDLALRKFITGVTDAKTGVTQEVNSRIPEVDPTALKDEKATTAEYNHTKDPVLVHTKDVVIYTLRIYNEGSRDGYATLVKDDLPEGLEFLPNHEINKYYGWSLLDKNDRPTTDIKNAKYAVTDYLSKEKETKDKENLLEAYEKADGTKLQTPAYKDIKIAFKVTEPQTSDRILTNYAQISSQTDEKGKHREDRDSTPNKWLNEDDEDYEKVKVQYFDLALRKWVTKAIIVQNGKEEIIETGHHAEDDPEDVVKVDLKKSKINSVVVKFEYKIRITNQGQIEGYAKEIKDYIPEGLKFDPADNPTWTQEGDNIIVTDQLKDTLLKPGESSEVTVILTWINSKTNLGLKKNIAEISKDYNDYETPDIDSTPDNFKDGEDDIDDAPVMLSVKTGNQYILYVMFVVLASSIGIIIFKKH